MRYPDTKDIAEHIIHDYSTRCSIIYLQNKIIQLSDKDMMAWCDDTLLGDHADELEYALKNGHFVDIDEDQVAQLKKEYCSTNIIELVKDYFHRTDKILRINYHPDTPDTIDPKTLNEMAERRKAIDDKYQEVKELYEKALKSKG